MQKPPFSDGVGLCNNQQLLVTVPPQIKVRWWNEAGGEHCLLLLFLLLLILTKTDVATATQLPLICRPLLITHPSQSTTLVYTNIRKLCKQ